MRSIRRALVFMLVAFVSVGSFGFADEFETPEPLRSRIENRLRGISDLAIRLALEEGDAYLSSMDPAEAEDCAVMMILRSETRLRFGNSPGAVRLELRRSYRALRESGSDLAWRKLLKARDKNERSAPVGGFGQGGRPGSMGSQRGKNGAS